MNEEHKTIFDPQTYREMSVPYESIEAANIALDGFYAELRELRKKYRIRDLSTVIGVLLSHDGKEHAVLADAHFGSVAQKVSMLAWALGRARAEHESNIDTLLKGPDAEEVSEPKSAKRKRSKP